MPKAPKPITSPPPVPGQTYDATVSGANRPSQSKPTQVYDADGGAGAAEAWPKVQEAGAADMSTGTITGGWPSDGTSDGGKWKQC